MAKLFEITPVKNLTLVNLRECDWLAGMLCRLESQTSAGISGGCLHTVMFCDQELYTTLSPITPHQSVWQKPAHIYLHTSLFCRTPFHTLLHTSLLYCTPSHTLLHTSLFCGTPHDTLLHTSLLYCTPVPYPPPHQSALLHPVPYPPPHQSALLHPVPYPPPHQSAL